MRQGVYSAPKYLYNYSPQSTKKWPQDIQCIIKSNNPQKGSLYLSNVQAAQNPATVKKLKIGAILSCAKGYMVSHPPSVVPHYKYIPGQDKQTFNISLHFEEAVEFIRQALQKTNIIVHCIAGVSRSASMVIAYFMKHRQLSFHQAFNEVKSKRKIISPNDGFIQHLKNYENKLKSSQSTVTNNSLNQSQQFQRTYSGQFYSPKKTYTYETNYQRINSAKNPESAYKQLNLKRNYQTGQKNDAFVSPRTKNYSSLVSYKSQSMTLIPDENKISPRYEDRYNKSYSKELSPRKTINYSNAKPSYLSREQVHQDRKTTSNYFSAMNEQLNQKYQAIRKKYDQQIQQLVKNRNSNSNSINNSLNKDNSTSTGSRNIYLQKKNSLQQSYNDKRNYYKNFGRRDTFNLYDRNLDGIDLKNNPRLNNFDSIYVPRISTGYAFNGPYYSKRYF